MVGDWQITRWQPMAGGSHPWNIVTAGGQSATSGSDWTLWPLTQAQYFHSNHLLSHSPVQYNNIQTNNWKNTHKRQDWAGKVQGGRRRKQMFEWAIQNLGVSRESHAGRRISPRQHQESGEKWQRSLLVLPVIKKCGCLRNMMWRCEMQSTWCWVRTCDWLGRVGKNSLGVPDQTGWKGVTCMTQITLSIHRQLVSETSLQVGCRRTCDWVHHQWFPLTWLLTGLPWHLLSLDIPLTQAHYYHLITLYTLVYLTTYWACLVLASTWHAYYLPMLDYFIVLDCLLGLPSLWCAYFILIVLTVLWHI